LFVAVFNSRGRGDLIALLREHGADPTAPNHSGQTPLGLARLIDNFDVAQFFADLPEQPTGLRPD
jgi:ankyrin repeat protein